MKMIIGKRENPQSKTTHQEGIVFVVGIILMCALFFAPLWRVESDPFEGEAILVMAGGEREEVKLPDNRAASTEEKWSFYDYIGELFADLIFGDG